MKYVMVAFFGFILGLAVYFIAQAAFTALAEKDYAPSVTIAGCNELLVATCGGVPLSAPSFSMLEV